MQNLSDTTQSRLAQNSLPQSQSARNMQSLSLTHGFFHKVINICGGGDTLHSLNKSPKNPRYSYKSAKKLFHAIIARAFNESPNQSKLSVIARLGNAQSWQSKQNLKSRILDCFDFLQKSRNGRVSGIIIARVLPKAIQKIKSFCFVWLSQKVESLYPLDSNPQSKIPPIRSWFIYFINRVKSCALDTSLHCVPLSMTSKVVVILRALARSIHFSNSRIIRNSLTLSESMCLRFTRFALLGLLCLDTRNIRLCECVL